MVQMRVDGGKPEANVERALARIAEAAKAGANVVVLPEALNLGWTHPSAEKLSELIPDGPTCQALREAAVENSIFVCAGLVERTGDKVFNSAVLFDPGGELLIDHRKINELDIAAPPYSIGDRLKVVDCALGRVGVIICADALAEGQVITRTLGLMGAKLILSPSSWAVPADHDQLANPYGQLWFDNYAPVAKALGLTIVGVSNVGPIEGGPWDGRICIGNSIAVGPAGETLAVGPFGMFADEILYIDV